MKLLLLSDVHLRHKTPIGRKDDFFASQQDKLRQVFNICNRHACRAIIQAGDFFDTSNPSNYVVTATLRLMMEYGIDAERLFCVLGQHDMYYYSDASRDRTASAVMEAGKHITIIDKPFTLFNQGSPRNKKGVRIYGQHWSDDVPEPDDFDGPRMLVCHSSVGDEPLFPGHELTSPRRLANEVKGKYDLVLCGDYHYPFDVTHAGVRIVNMGCMVRLQRAERDMKQHEF